MKTGRGDRERETDRWRQGEGDREARGIHEESDRERDTGK